MTLVIDGFCEPRFKALEAAFRANFDHGYDVGASLAATHHGRLVVDLWGGSMDAGRTIPWRRDTIVPMNSTTKIMMMICALILVDRGQLDLDRTVGSYWPEFTQGGKGAVTVRDALTHQAGVPGFAVPASLAVSCDWEAITAKLAAEPHWFGGERRFCYHALTFGYLIGELVRRADGRRPARFFLEEIAWPLDADFQIGLADKADLARYATPILPSVAPPLEGIAARLLLSVEPADGSWESFARENPSSGGYGHGRSIAQVCAIIANRGVVNGRRFLSEATVAEAGREQVYAQDPYLGWIRLGLGFGIDSKEYPAPSPTCMHWGGVGGSVGLMDPLAGVSLGFAPNNWTPPPEQAEIASELDPRGVRLMAALQGILADLSPQPEPEPPRSTMAPVYLRKGHWWRTPNRPRKDF